MVVVKRSACSPSTPTIRAQIPLKPIVFSVNFVFEKNENKQKEAAVGPFKKAETRLPTRRQSLDKRTLYNLAAKFVKLFS